MAEAGGTRTTSRMAKQARIVALIENHEIGSQSELADLLGAESISVSQGTLSKDLLEIGAVRVRNTSGTLVYAPPATEVASDSTAREARLSQVCAELLVSVASSGNLAVLKTPPGAAQYFASAIDRVSFERMGRNHAGGSRHKVAARANSLSSYREGMRPV